MTEIAAPTAALRAGFECLGTARDKTQDFDLWLRIGTAVGLDTGILYRDDNLRRLRSFEADSYDLIYLDPPFFSNRRYEVIWGDEAEVRSFEDRWEGGIGHYVDWMRKRAVEMYRVLKPTGSLYLHCDPSASHYLKVMLDSIFIAPGGFRTEIIWKRSSAHSDTRQGRRQHGRIHDVILFYAKSEDWIWNPIYTPDAYPVRSIAPLGQPRSDTTQRPSRASSSALRGASACDLTRPPAEGRQACRVESTGYASHAL